MASRTPWRVVVLPYLLGDDEPLIGDLIEERPRRSSAWFWRQVSYAVGVRIMAGATAAIVFALVLLIGGLRATARPQGP